MQSNQSKLAIMQEALQSNPHVKVKIKIKIKPKEGNQAKEKADY